MNPQPVYLEDLHVGQRSVSGVYHIDKERMLAFAAEFDPQPFHLDEKAGDDSPFQGLAASGWFTAAVAMRLLVTSGWPIANGGLVGLGGEISWLRPTRAGDTLRVVSEVMEIRPSRSKPDRAIVTIRNTTLNQRDEPVQIFTAKTLVFRRPAKLA